MLNDRLPVDPRLDGLVRGLVQGTVKVTSGSAAATPGPRQVFLGTLLALRVGRVTCLT